jgi:hypothetical protein
VTPVHLATDKANVHRNEDESKALAHLLARLPPEWQARRYSIFSCAVEASQRNQVGNTPGWIRPVR